MQRQQHFTPQTATGGRNNLLLRLCQTLLLALAAGSW
jgi:hypothetical protein